MIGILLIFFILRFKLLMISWRIRSVTLILFSLTIVFLFFIYIISFHHTLKSTNVLLEIICAFFCKLIITVEIWLCLRYLFLILHLTVQIFGFLTHRTTFQISSVCMCGWWRCIISVICIHVLQFLNHSVRCLLKQSLLFLKNGTKQFLKIMIKIKDFWKLLDF